MLSDRQALRPGKRYQIRNFSQKSPKASIKQQNHLWCHGFKSIQWLVFLLPEIVCPALYSNWQKRATPCAQLQTMKSTFDAMMKAGLWWRYYCFQRKTPRTESQKYLQHPTNMFGDFPEFFLLQKNRTGRCTWYFPKNPTKPTTPKARLGALPTLRFEVPDSLHRDLDLVLHSDDPVDNRRSPGSSNISGSRFLEAPNMQILVYLSTVKNLCEMLNRMSRAKNFW